MKRLFIVLALSFCVLVPVTKAETPAAALDTVLVSWRSLSLTQGDYEAALRGIPEVDRFTFQLNQRRISELLNSMLLTRTLAAEARQSGLDKDPLVQREMALAAERVLATRRLETFEKSIKVPNMVASAEERYHVKPEEFRTPERVRASHVLVEAKTRSHEEAHARAEEIRSKALGGADFAKLASEFSDDPSAKGNQGDLGFFARGRMAKPFEDAAFAMEKPGDISPVVKTQFGYHVILLHEKQPAGQRPFAEVKDELVAQMTKTYIEKEKAKYAEAIVSDKSIVMNTAALDKLKKELPKASATPAAAKAGTPAPGK